MMVSRVQRQEHHNLATIQRAKLKRAHECSKGLRFVKTLNPNAKPNKDGQSSQWGLLPNDNNERKYESDETNTFIVSFFPSLNSRAPLYTSTFPLAFSIAFLMYTLKEKKKRKRKTLLMYIVYIDVSNYTPSCTHVSSYVVWRVHPRKKFTTNLLLFSIFWSFFIWIN